MRQLPAWIAAAPAIALALASVWLTGAAAYGHGLWPPDEVTLSEAVATRNAAEASRLLGLGSDPNRATVVRRGLLVDRPVTVTPLEAAVWVRDAFLVTVLLDGGALPQAPAVRVLRCLNDAQPDPAVRTALEALSAAPWPTCEGVPLPSGAAR